MVNLLLSGCLFFMIHILYQQPNNIEMQMGEHNHTQNWNSQPTQQSPLIERSTKLTSNLYEIRKDKLISTFFKYDFVTAEGESVQQNKLVYSNMTEKKSQFESKIQFVCQFQEGMLGGKRVDGLIELAEQTNRKLQLKIKLVETYTLEDLLKENCKRAVLTHIIDPIVKKSIYNSEPIIRTDHIGNHKIVITPNFQYDFVEIKGKIYLSTNVKLDIKDHASLLSYFDRYKDQESHKKLMINQQVIANYGSRNLYKIINIDYTKTPQSINLFNNKQCTFVEFYKEKHIININNMNQPLLIATRCSKNKNQVQTIFLIPELVSFYNSVNPNQMNEQLQEKIEKKKWQLPQEKEIYALRIMKEIGDQEIVKKSALNFDGIVLKPPAIRIQNRVILPEEGFFSFRGKIQKSVEIKNWGIVYIEGKDKQSDNNDISKLLFFMKGVCTQFGIRITNEPGMIPVNGGVNEWKKGIQNDIQRFGMPQFLIFLLRQEEMSFYATLKQYIVMELKCLSQVIRRKSIDIQSRKPFNIISDILLQIEAKIGGILWEIGSNSELSKRKLMFGGIHIVKEKEGYSISLVGCMNPQGTQSYSFNKRGYTKISDINFELLFIHWAKNYVMNNRVPPDTIIVYRQLSEQEIESDQIASEINQLKSAIKKIGEKTKTINYNPPISYISVVKNHHVEVYSKQENEQKQVILGNPEPGTVVIEQNQQDDKYDFYLNANFEYENTSKPLKFTVFGNAGTSPENLIGFTYEQCYNCYNYKGALNIPAHLQYARKLAIFSETTGVQIGYEDKMTKALYFL